MASASPNDDVKGAGPRSDPKHDLAIGLSWCWFSPSSLLTPVCSPEIKRGPQVGRGAECAQAMAAASGVFGR